MPEVNYLAVVLAALSAFLLGGLWYSPLLFANRWMALSGQSEDQLKSGSMTMIFGGAFLLNLIAAYVFALFLGPAPELKFAVGAGFAAGLFWVMASLGVNYLFERRPLGLWLINGLYFTIQFTLFGLILGLMG
jgi:hypothetical protein